MAEQPPYDAPISTPCISVCLLDEQQICLGCFRTADEIAGWCQYSEAERCHIIDQLAARAASR